MRVTSIIFDGGTYDENGDYIGGSLRVQWSCGSNGLAALTDADIPAEMIPPMAPLDTIILTETYVPFRPITRIGGLEPFEWENILVTRPRIVREVTLDGGTCASGGA